ncbi:MAG: hypothetical protein J0M24_14000 [Verrucomicrobia bacterium]|nr:hypothetical protein [Verrucomicrobiota bacterium]
MKRPPQSRARRKQQTSEELIATILGFIGRHWYQGDTVRLAKDRPRLLRWVILKPATFLDERAVTVSADTYRDLFLDTQNGVLLEAIRHGAQETIQYPPAYLGTVVDSWLRIQGDRLYERAKNESARSAGEIAEQLAQALAGRPQTGVDPVRQMAQADALLRQSARRVQRPCKPAADSQLSLL